MQVGWLYDAFWSERIWLPPNTTWNDLKNKPGDAVVKPEASDLWLAFPTALLIFFARYFVMNIVAVKLGALYDIRQGDCKIDVERNAKLESAYKQYKKPSSAQLKTIASQLNMSTEKVHNWFRKRRNLDKASKLGRLQDSLWKFTFYGATWTYGMYHFSAMPWARDLIECWLGFPNHNLDSEIKWFYVVQISFYLLCVATHFHDVRRTDFWAMLVHHAVTLGLMYMSFVNNHVRVGCIILLTHDIADVIMEFAKIMNYLGFARCSEYSFFSFVICWIVTRLTYFPFVVIRSVMFDATATLGHDYTFQRFFLLLLLILLCLHVFWFSLIVKMIIKKLLGGRIDGDVRSESERESADENGNDTGAQYGCKGESEKQVGSKKSN